MLAPQVPPPMIRMEEVRVRGEGIADVVVV